MVNVIYEATQGKSDEEKANRVIEVGGFVSRATLDIVAIAGFDKSFDALENPDNKLFQTYQKIFQPDPGRRIFQYLAFVIPLWILVKIPTQRNKDMKAAVSVIRDSAAALIASKRAKMEKGEANDVDILNVAMKSGEFTDEQLVNQLMTFLAAGHETTASSMQWAVLSLCKHPDIQKRLREAIQESGSRQSMTKMQS